LKLIDREAAEKELLELLEAEDRERVSPKVELARNFPGNIIGFRGGRSAGAKTTGMVSLNVQESNRKFHRVACLREIQESLEESLYQAVQECVDKLKYPGWQFPRSQGYCQSPTGSKWIFRGLKDMRAARNTKGLQGFDRFLLDEAATIAGDSLDVLLPLLGKAKGARLFFAYNPETEMDPITEKVWYPYQNDPDALLIDMRPEGLDNPWWNESAQKLSDKMKLVDPDLWEHVYGGQPRKKGQNAIMSRVLVRRAMERRSGAEGGARQIGVDVARFGDDKTIIVGFEGLRQTRLDEYAGQDTIRTANCAWDAAGRDRTVPIKVDDDGVGGAVVDYLRFQFGANVIPVRNGMPADDQDLYTTIADEQWFNFPIDDPELELFDDIELMAQLTNRLYDYTTKNQRKVEPKKEYKKRHGKSPDKADATLLALYQPKNRVIISEQDRDEIAARYR
jgi:phage terminase large subunit